MRGQIPVTYEHLEPIYPLGWRCLRFEADVLPPRWHVHPEYELTHIVRGVGTRFIGDSIEEYQPGDLVLIGPRVPHTYASIPDGGDTEVLVVHFTRDFLGPAFFDLPGFAGLAELLEASANGLRFPDAPAALTTLDGQQPPAEKTVALLEALVALSRQPYVSLATGRSSPTTDPASERRIESIVAHVHEHYRSPITLQEIADVAHMNPSAVSRLFSRSTTFTLTRYITIVRLNAACRLLRDTDSPVAAIASECGFGNLSNFNRRFREVKQSTPKEYRSLFRSGLGEGRTQEHLPNVRPAREAFRNDRRLERVAAAAREAG